MVEEAPSTSQGFRTDNTPRVIEGSSRRSRTEATSNSMASRINRDTVATRKIMAAATKIITRVEQLTKLAVGIPEAVQTKTAAGTLNSSRNTEDREATLVARPALVHRSNPLPTNTLIMQEKARVTVPPTPTAETETLVAAALPCATMTTLPNPSMTITALPATSILHTGMSLLTSGKTCAQEEMTFTNGVVTVVSITSRTMAADTTIGIVTRGDSVVTSNPHREEIISMSASGITALKTTLEAEVLLVHSINPGTPTCMVATLEVQPMSPIM